jgi:hypothetical protein
MICYYVPLFRIVWFSKVMSKKVGSVRIYALGFFLIMLGVAVQGQGTSSWDKPGIDSKHFKTQQETQHQGIKVQKQNCKC